MGVARPPDDITHAATTAATKAAANASTRAYIRQIRNLLSRRLLRRKRPPRVRRNRSTGRVWPWSPLGSGRIMALAQRGLREVGNLEAQEAELLSVLRPRVGATPSTRQGVWNHRQIGKADLASVYAPRVRLRSCQHLAEAWNPPQIFSQPNRLPTFELAALDSR
jgi:hypothetical protein